jgi:hypothetical protein
MLRKKSWKNDWGSWWNAQNTTAVIKRLHIPPIFLESTRQNSEISPFVQILRKILSISKTTNSKPTKTTDHINKHGFCCLNMCDGEWYCWNNPCISAAAWNNWTVFDMRANNWIPVLTMDLPGSSNRKSRNSFFFFFHPYNYFQVK